MSIAQRLSTLRPALVVYAAGQRVLHPFRPDPATMPLTALIESDQRLAATLLRDGLV